MSARPSRFSFTQPGPLRLYSTEELLALEPPSWLIEGILPAGGLVGLYGRPGSAKSFLAIDMALAVASGRAWRGHAVEPGFVVYVAAEGGSGVGKRVLAWLLHAGLQAKDVDVAWLTEAVPVHADSEQLNILFDRLTGEIRRHPTMVVIDTLARCFDGDENLQEDMGRFIAGVDMLRHELRATVCIVHHTRLAGDRARGSTAFEGAADTMMMTMSEGGLIALSCEKQKDYEPFETVELELKQIQGTESCVLIESQIRVKENEIQAQVLEALRGHQPCSWDAWEAATGLPKGGAFQKYAQRLLRTTGKVVKVDGLWRVREA